MDSRRDPALLAAALLALVIALVTARSGASWIGQTFPGFLVLENRVVASAGLARWPAVESGEIYQWEVVAVDGRPLGASALRDYVATRPVGTEIVYGFRSGDRVLERRIESRRFDGLDFTLLFGSYLFCGLGLAGAAVTIRFLRRKDPLARGSALSLWIIGLWALTATDLYGPYRFFRLHALLECFLFAGTLHLACVFPQPRGIAQRRPALVWAPYAVAALLALWSQLSLYDPGSYVITHRLAMGAFGCALIALISSQLWTYLRPPGFEARQRVKVLALGSAAALTPQVVLSLGSAWTGGQASENLMGWSGIFFPLAIGYAVLRHDLLQVDAMLRRTVSYAVLTAGVAGTYAAAAAGAEALFQGALAPARPLTVSLFACSSVLVLLPLRDRVQSAVDRLFFRSAYDFRRLVEDASRRLAAVTDLDVIRSVVRSVVEDALQPEWIVFEVRPEADERSHRSQPVSREPAALDGGEGPVEADEGCLSVPFVVEGRVVAILDLGRRLSGRLYGGEDRRLLRTLANQGAVAVENALALREVQQLNQTLEQKVVERTSELVQTLDELRETQRQMVHQEKMVSLGQLVAGVAHEINNPLHFVVGNLSHLREHTDALVQSLRGYEVAVEDGDPSLLLRLREIREKHDVEFVLDDLASLLAACEEGVERATAIVRNLRSFSRLDSGTPSQMDMAASLDATLNLLHSRMTGIQVVREYDDPPLVECLEGQVNQVLMNLVANAAEAVADAGTITIRARAGDGRESAIVEVEDDGCGIPAEVLDRIFEPFFTTKPVGQGTGLGLAISYGVVARHGGRLEVESETDRGTRFRLELPCAYGRGAGSSEGGGPEGGAT